MRNFTLPLVASLLLTLLTLNVSAQKTSTAQQTPGNASRAHCGTMEALEMWFNQNPAARAQYLKNVEEGQKMAEAARVSGTSNESYRLQAIVTIPVVVHLVLPAADQAKVTTADVLWQINKLNEDFAGTNADSTNATNFYNIRGRTQIRFCLASQDANGNPTNGINRVYSSITDFNSGNVGQIKHASSCGADSWDPNRYFNIWVAKSTSLLGIATFPTTGAADEQGIALALDGFSNNPAYVHPAFNLGRTAVHEAGHYFGLYHNWGDDGTGCGTDDFRQVPGTCLLPANLLLGDTPNQAGATGGCPTGVRVDGCSPASPGINYQNYMDYTDDACYSMFTAKQAERAEYILQNCRLSLTTSNGCAPVTLYANDAASKLLSPGSSCYPGAIGTSFCQGSTFSATFMLRNTGTSNLTSVTLNAVVGAGTPVTANWTGNLPPYELTIVTINGISTGTTTGTQQLKVYTTNPNGAADQRTSNDTATINLTINAGGGVPNVTEGFEATTFPPTGWSVVNPNSGSITWARTTLGKNSGLASARINFYSYSGSTGHLDHLVTPAVDVTDADSIIVDFARAYRQYSASLSDTLMIQLATQCGATTFPITAWKKGGSQLATTPGTVTSNWAPVTADWLRERIDLRSFVPVGTTSLLVSFTSKNGYGQNLYLDDINVYPVLLLRRDAQLRAITGPASKVCTGSITPSVEIFNNGKDTLTSVKIVYRILGPSFTHNDSLVWSGKLPQGQGAVVNLKQLTLPAPGTYTIQAWTKEPNNNSDQNTSNDTSTVVSFRFVATAPLPLTESFESTSFPPANWARVNQDGQGTWFRTTAASRLGSASAVIDNYNYDAKGTIDDLETPQLTYSGIDSAFLTFQLSHATYLYPGSTGLALDSFQVLVTKDCGQTFTSVYNKWGEDLQTVGNPNEPFTNLFIPTGHNQWRKETVNLSQVLGTSGSAQIIFRAKGNYGNTILLDDINITTKTLPARLKQNGYMIAPNPFNSAFVIQHYLRPTNLRGLQVTNSAGQIVYSRSFNGNADSYMQIDLTRFAAGMYAVKLIYDNKVITERVIKRGQ
ncbi:MAG TPA: choice-of-anchor J domain-containing protein [Chitinophagaceae bacterium]